jgi:hypothetical protein
MMIKKTHIIVLFCIIKTITIAQTKHIKLPNSHWISARYNHTLHDSSIFYFESNFRALIPDYKTNIVYQRIAFEGGYEHLYPKKSIGCSFKYVDQTNYNLIYYRAYYTLQRHFIKQNISTSIIADYIHHIQLSETNYLRIAILMSLHQKIHKNWGYKLDIQPFVKLKSGNETTYSNRLIDKSRFSISGTYSYTNQHLIALFAMQDNEYYWQSANNPARPINLNQYVFGINYTYTHLPHDHH